MKLHQFYRPVLGIVAVFGAVEFEGLTNQWWLVGWTALGGAFLVGMMLPHFGRVKIACPDCGRINQAKAKRFSEGDTFACKKCGKTLTFTTRQERIVETLAEKRP